MKNLSVIIRCALVALLPLLGSVPSSAATYIEPDLSEELFRLEKIPLQMDKMKQLSGHLIVLARRPNNRQPVQQRATAQLIALAEALAPSSQEVRNLNRELARGKPLEYSSSEEITKTTHRLGSFKRWLGHADAGEEANRLAHFLNDATKVLNPETFNNRDLADWKNAIPSLDQYKSSPQNNPPPAKIAKDDTPKKSTEDLEDDPWDKPAQKNKKYGVTQMEIRAPFTIENTIEHEDPRTESKRYSRTRKHTVSDISISIIPRSDPEDASFRILSISRIAGSFEDSLYKRIRRTLQDLVQNRHGNLGPHRMTITIPGGSYARSNELALTAPVAMMLESSIANKPLRKDVLVCADIDSSGKFHTPANLWTSLNHLRTLKTGGRLIVPREAFSLVMQILVLEKPDFFTRWEIFAVDTLDEAMLVAASKIEGKLAEADMLYDSIQNLARKSAVTSITSNRAVRTRLSQIATLSPGHLSARALLLHGSSKRPRNLSQEGLAHSILDTVTHIRDTLVNPRNYKHPSSETMKSQHEKARAVLDPLDRLIDRSNENLHEEATELANDLRTLGNLIRRGKDSEDWYEHVRVKVYPEYHRTAKKAQDLLKRVRAAAGYPDIAENEEEKSD